MTSDQAVRFLQEHQPMPTGVALTEDLTSKYVEAVHALQAPDGAYSERELRALVGSLSFGLGIYEHVLDLVLACPDPILLRDVLVGALSASEPTTLYWACHAAARAPDPQYVTLLDKAVRHDSVGVRLAASEALSQHGEAGRLALVGASRRETDPDVRDLLQMILDEQ